MRGKDIIDWIVHNHLEQEEITMETGLSAERPGKGFNEYFGITDKGVQHEIAISENGNVIKTIDLIARTVNNESD